VEKDIPVSDKEAFCAWLKHECHGRWPGERSTSLRSVKIVKKTDELATVAGYGVVFGGLDLEGDSFLPETDFMLDLVPKKLVFYDHAMGVVKHALGTAKAEADKYGLWVEAEIQRAKEYADYILDLVESGILGWSSGSVGHLIERSSKGFSRWPIVEFSLTPTPAEPRTLGVQYVKTLLSGANLTIPEALAEASRDAPARGGESHSADIVEATVESMKAHWGLT
jgi:phage head maturation protease